MSKSSLGETGNQESEPEDMQEAPTGQVVDNSYASTKGDAESVPVVPDEEATGNDINPEEADSDKQLERDEEEAIDKNNIVKDRLRGNKPKEGALRELDDVEMGIAEEDTGR